MLTAFVGLGAAPVLILIRYEEMVRFHALPAVRGRTRSGTPDSASGLALARRGLAPPPRSHIRERARDESATVLNV
jgi:hypothetical protein